MSLVCVSRAQGTHEYVEGHKGPCLRAPHWLSVPAVQVLKQGPPAGDLPQNESATGVRPQAPSGDAMGTWTVG